MPTATVVEDLGGMVLAEEKGSFGRMQAGSVYLNFGASRLVAQTVVARRSINTVDEWFRFPVPTLFDPNRGGMAS